MPDHHRNVIETRHLTKRYADLAALNNLDLSVPEHTIFGFLGPNGAGKTTTMKLLLGLARPTSGTATIFGLDTTADSLAIRQRIGYLPQQPRFYDEMTARETLRFTGSLFYSGPQAAIEQRVQEMLALVGLEEKADRPVRGFSGGERQRLGIAQAQINEPELLILDEPAAALDPLGRRDVLNIMEQLRERTTIFYSTHILDDVQQVSDVVAILNRGELVTQGPIQAMLAGDGKVVYTVTLSGPTGEARQELLRQPWVASVADQQRDGHHEWQVTVTDPNETEANMLRLILAHPEVNVLSFNRRHFELEEVFIRLVEGGAS